jgi:hypothetical protein
VLLERHVVAQPLVVLEVEYRASIVRVNDGDPATKTVLSAG